MYYKHRPSQNARKVKHIKGKLLDQAVILFICVPFQNGNFYKGKNLLLLCLSPLRAVPYGLENHFYHIGWPHLNVAIFIMHVRNVSYANDKYIHFTFCPKVIEFFFISIHMTLKFTICINIKIRTSKTIFWLRSADNAICSGHKFENENN